MADGVSLQEVAWNRGEYDKTVLSALYCDNRNRAILVAEKFRVMHPNWQEACGLGFCVSVEHATFMAEVFNDIGIDSRCLSGDTESGERRQVLEDLRKGAIRMVFTCDLLNEGIDIPEVDTLLFLRPTASATVFSMPSWPRQARPWKIYGPKGPWDGPRSCAPSVSCRACHPCRSRMLKRPDPGGWVDFCTWMIIGC